LPHPSSAPPRPDRASLRAWSGRALLALVGALLALGVLVAVLASGRGGSETAAASPAALSAREEALRRRQTRYRIVGCRSQGDVAHRGAGSRDGRVRHAVAIGFDDGPAADTPAFVRMLERSKARATFFLVGRQVSDRSRSTMLRELIDGDVLGDHTWSHPDLDLRGVDVRGQLLHTIAAIKDQTGYTPCIFRPPYGDYDQSVLRAARSLGLSTVSWNVDPADYTQPGAAAIERRVLSQVRPGSIIISHDGGGPRGQTLAAYPAIIRALRLRGYGIVTVNELLGYRPVYAPCVRLCDGLGLPRRALPRNAILAPATG
jgi:peptidoglycan/xylan/chitin deacetylase (PgdA/CDA1 family)